MSDNFVANAGSGGSTFAADDVGGVLYLRTKVGSGADGVFNDATTTNPLPVALTSTGGLLDLDTLTAGSAKIGDPIPTRTFLCGGVDGSSNTRALLMDTSGRPYFNINTMPSITVGSALPAGSNNIGDVDIASIAAGDNVIGRCKISDGTEVANVDSNNRLETTSYQGSTWSVQNIPGTSGGCSISRVVAVASTNATVAKASAGHLYGYEIFNDAAAVRYVKFVNKASSPTVGSDSVAMTVMLPADSSRAIWFPEGIAFSLGITYYTVTGFADSDTAAVTANDLIVQVFYK